MYNPWVFNFPLEPERSNKSKPDGVRAKYNSFTPFTPKYVEKNVTRSSDPAQVYIDRIRRRQIILQNRARDSHAKKEIEATHAKRVAEKARSAAGVLGQKHAREKGLWKLDKSAAK